MLQQTEPESGGNGSGGGGGNSTPVTATESTTTGAAGATGNALAVVPVTSSVATLPPNAADLSKNQPKRLHVSNIPFRFRDPDLRAMFGVSSILF